MKSRIELLHSMPKGGVVAEIGVWEGDFSQKIMDIVEPTTLVLVDKWEHFQDPMDPRVTKATQEEMDARYNKVVHRFQKYGPSVRIIRRPSVYAAGQFSVETFDWVYIDAQHTYNACYDDLLEWWPLIKYGGHVLGHDYCTRCGVKAAVDDFVENTPAAEFILYTNEGTPSFKVRKVG